MRGAARTGLSAGFRPGGRHYGDPPSLTTLDAGDNLNFTTDFRRVYATMAEGWLGQAPTPDLFNGAFEPFRMFA